MALKLYNTLGRQLQEFKPLKTDGSVGLYSCGPTVYNYPHIGNYRAYVFADTLKRVLQYNGYQVDHVMNLTDVDDKTIRDSQKTGQSLKEFTEFYTKAFFKDLKSLNILPADKYPKASEKIDAMVSMINRLLNSGDAYSLPDGSIYFLINKFKSYGELSQLNKDCLKTNASGRITTDEYGKEDVRDFVLWKARTPDDGENYWEKEFYVDGSSVKKNLPGRPGWHIECSAMSIEALQSDTIDIHTGGIDLIFPHHENEIAQSECATGKHFVNYWLHNEHILIDGKKMSKSLDNFTLLNDITDRELSPLAYRYLLLTAHYRSQLNFTWESLSGAQNALIRLYRQIGELAKQPAGTANLIVKKEYSTKFTSFINDDLNTPQALALVWEMLKDERLPPSNKLLLIKKWDTVFGLQLIKNSNIQNRPIPIIKLVGQIKILVSEREAARKNGNWPEADRLRDIIKEAGYEIEDTPKGLVITKK